MPDEPKPESPEDYYDADDPPSGNMGSRVDTSKEEGKQSRQAIRYATSAAKYAGEAISFPFRWFFRLNSERLTAIATMFIAAFTIALSVTSYLQWRVMDRTLDAMKTSGNVTADQTWRAIDNLNWAARSMDQSAKQTQKLIAPSEQMARDNGNLLKGSEAAFLNISTNVDIPKMEVYFDAVNTPGKVQARDFRADEIIAIRSWPNKHVRLGPFHHLIVSKRIGNTNLALPGPIQDNFTIPQITPDIAKELANGEAYVTLEVHASYDDGFGTRIYWPPAKGCKAWINVGYLKCQTGPRSFTDGWTGGATTCEDIDRYRESEMNDLANAKKQCQNPN